MEKLLPAVAESQGNWSATANALKATHERTRSTTFVLSVVAALLTAIASQTEGHLRTSLALVSALLFAIVSFLTARFSGAAQTQSWVRARVASEALKRESWKYAALAAPYDDPATRAARFGEEVEKIEADVDDLAGQRTAGKRGSTPDDVITAAEYVQRRIRAQVETFFEPAAAACQAAARSWRRLEFWLALATACITAVIAFADKQVVSGINFDFAALIAVLTTISGAILAYIEASRYDYLVASYRATARRLRAELLSGPAPDVVVPSSQWSAYVQRCESILQDENGSWAAKFSKPV